MELTENCDFYSEVDEAGINLLVRHIMRKRPSLFNYATDMIVHDQEPLCVPIDAAPEVIKKGNPLLTLEQPLTLLGTGGSGAGLNFCAQLASAEVDLHPGSVFSLPPQLDPPLKEQRFAISATVCAGIGCPDKELIGPDMPLDALQTLPFELQCFCIQLFATGHFEVDGPKGAQVLQGKLDSLEIVNIDPEGLENSLECYVEMLIRLVILPRMALALETLVLDLGDLATITLFAAPVSNAIPNNPAVAENKVKVYVDLEVIP